MTYEEIILKNKQAVESVCDTWDGKSIEFNSIRYSIESNVSDMENDLFSDNQTFLTDENSFNITALLKELGFNSLIYGYGFKRLV